MNFAVGEDGRWVLGDPNTKCPQCGATAAVHYAANGRAELWHAPTDCCAYARERENRFARMARDDERRADEAHEEARANMRTAA